MVRFPRWLLLLVLIGLAAPQAWAQTDEENEEQRQLEAAIQATQERADRLAARQAVLARESDDLSDELARVAAEAREWEEEVAQVELTLETLVQEADERRAVLMDARERLTAMSGALLRISLLPPEMLIARPGAPSETVRAGLVMRQLVPRLESEATRLQREVADLESLEAQITEENAEALAARARLAEEETRLTGLLQQRRDLLQITAAEQASAAAEAQTLSASAENLSGLVSSATRRIARGAPRVPPVPPKDRQVVLGEEAPPPAAEAPAEAAPSETETQVASLPAEDPLQEEPILRELRAMPEEPGGLAEPIAGELVQRFNADRGDQQGLRFAGRAGARVTAPFDGVVVYAGQFRSYGLVLILEHGTGYHSVLAELGLIDAVLGQRVVAGEPIGALEEQSDGPPELYVELWRDGQTIDPAPWYGLDNQ
ncbi:MAG: peptidoglycan DD-metalloendopeptidase family protein [Pseudomonadota bacterium]